MRVAELAKVITIRVAVDSALAADMLAAAAGRAGVTVGILVDIDVGFHRTGVQTPKESLELARHVADTRGLRLDGIMIYPGHVLGPPQRQGPMLWEVGQRLGEAVAAWRSRGLEPRIISGGSTPTAPMSNLVPHLTEIRPGTYIFNDYNTILSGQCTLANCAARVACTVISSAVPGKVVLDAGSKALGSDRAAIDPDANGYGLLVDYPGARVVRLSEEHGEVDVSRCERAPALGERVYLVPNHICPCINLHDRAWLILPDGAASRVNIDARGCLS
jgi:D-serine deaminase-like pyridoxal phosphate-dependent protein